MAASWWWWFWWHFVMQQWCVPPDYKVESWWPSNRSKVWFSSSTPMVWIIGSQLLLMGVGSKLPNKLCTTTKNKWELSFLHSCKFYLQNSCWPLRLIWVFVDLKLCITLLLGCHVSQFFVFGLMAIMSLRMEKKFSALRKDSHFIWMNTSATWVVMYRYLHTKLWPATTYMHTYMCVEC